MQDILFPYNPSFNLRHLNFIVDKFMVENFMAEKFTAENFMVEKLWFKSSILKMFQLLVFYLQGSTHKLSTTNFLTLHFGSKALNPRFIVENEDS